MPLSSQPKLPSFTRVETSSSVNDDTAGLRSGPTDDSKATWGYVPRQGLLSG